MQHRPTFLGHKPILVVFALILSHFFAIAQPKLGFVDFATGLNSVVDLAHCGDSRLFVVEKKGTIYILDSLGNKQATPFLDITNKVLSDDMFENGLLGLAFHPNFAQNGWFFVFYIDTSGLSTIARYSLLPGSDSLADPASEKILKTFPGGAINHLGGCMKFGPDGYLYLSTGEGPSTSNSQNLNSLLGKILRIDVNTDTAPYYTIPPTNPLVGAPEIWSWGLRNPWRFSFDRLTGDMWIGDVGGFLMEEINFAPASTGGQNYGWACYEGTLLSGSANCFSDSAHSKPVFEYTHNGNCGSVTGGYVYRGQRYDAFKGQYIFADYCNGRFWGTRPDSNGGFNTVLLANLNSGGQTCFGEDQHGELYVSVMNKVQKVVDLCANFKITPNITPTCPGVNKGRIQLVPSGHAGFVNYTWTGGLHGPTLPNLPAGTYTVLARDGSQCEIRDTFVVETLYELPDSATVLYQNGVLQLVNQGSGPVGNFQWLLNGSPIPGATDSTLMPSENGTYGLQYTTVSGCVYEWTTTVQTRTLDGIQQASVSPNPNNGTVSVMATFDLHKDIRLALYSLRGELVLEKSASGRQMDWLLSFENWPNGLYILQLTDGLGIWTKSIVKTAY